jgi:hypothetical protein
VGISVNWQIDKVKAHPRTGHEGSVGVQVQFYCSLPWVWVVTAILQLLCPRKETQHPFSIIGKYQRTQTLKDVLHLSVEYAGQSYSLIDRKVFKCLLFHALAPSMIEHCHKTGMCEDSKNTLLLDNCNAHSYTLELRFFTFLQMWCPLFNLWTKESYDI